MPGASQTREEHAGGGRSGVPQAFSPFLGGPRGSLGAGSPVFGPRRQTARHSLEHAGQTWYFCSAHCRERFAAAPESYLSRAGHARAERRGYHLHLSHAPRGAPGRARLLPDLWHGARAGRSRGSRGAQRRARRHAAALLHRSSPDVARLCLGNGGASRQLAYPPQPAARQLAATGAGDPGGALGGLAFLRARLGLAQVRQSQHVYLDCHGDRRRLDLQCAGDHRARPLSRHRAGRRRGGPSTGKPRASSPDGACGGSQTRHHRGRG
jgi:YHS domain-containing protein